MVKIELDINGISFFVNTTWKTDAVPAVGDIVIVDKESISQFDRVELRKTPSNQAFTLSFYAFPPCFSAIQSP